MNPLRPWGLALAFAPLLAQTPHASLEEEDKAFQSLKMLLNTPVITAARREQAVKEAHSTLRVFTASDLRVLGATTLAEALKLVAGLDVYFEYDQMKTSVGTRGLKGDLVSKRMLFLLDGRPMNLPVNGDFDFDMRLPLNFVKQVEIIRGPGSSLYGANAFLGIVNIRTQSPKNDGFFYDGAVGMRAGSFGERALDFSLAHRFSDDAAFAFWGTSSQADEYGILRKWYGSTLPATTADISEGYRLGDVRTNWSFKHLTFTGGVTSSGVDHNNKGQYTRDSAVATSQTREDALRSRFADLAYQRDFGKAWDLGLHAYFNVYVNDRLYSRGDITGSTPRNLLGKETLWGLQAQAQWKPKETFRLLFGGDYAVKASDNNQRTYLQNARTREAAIFVEAGWKPLPWLDAVAGGRYDRHSEFAGQFSPRASFIASFLREGRARISYATAFRAPTFTELFLTASKGLPLRPETIRTLEASLSYVFGGVKVSATAFDNRVKEQITYVTTALCYGNQADEVHSRGLEVEAEAVLAGRWRPFLAATLQNTGSDVPGDKYANQLVAAPRRKLAGGLMFRTVDWEAALTGAWIDHQRDGYFDPAFGNVSPTYLTLAGRIAWMPQPGWSFALTVKNMLDRRYYDKGHDPRFTDPADYRARNNEYPGRSFVGEVRWNW
ncbi:MAG: TonB-dependent receptor [Acidobacteria bacterium]|nr:TonB-dependent receptor [Acidobacteriota bacterium]